LVRDVARVGTAPLGAYASRVAKLDLDAAAAFLETIPEGRWTSYGDVAVAAGGRTDGAQGIAAWILGSGHRLSNVYRVLNMHGEISPGWKPAGPHLPATPAEVRARLESEGVRFGGGRADQRLRWKPR
jgi:alkylated DNA nucleotide flippase Atl1